MAPAVKCALSDGDQRQILPTFSGNLDYNLFKQVYLNLLPRDDPALLHRNPLR